MSLGAFLTDSSLGNWADELEDLPVTGGYARRAYESGRSAGGGFGEYERPSSQSAARSEDYIQRGALPLPTKPPFTAHVGNLAYDVTESEIEGFFTTCKVKTVRILMDRMDNRPKGFGYVEFDDLDSLKSALELNGGLLTGRSIRTAKSSFDNEGTGMADEATDWRRGAPLPPLPESRRGGADDYHSSSRHRLDLPTSNADATNTWERRGPLAVSDSYARDSSLHRDRTGQAEPLSNADTGVWRSGNITNQAHSHRTPSSPPAGIAATAAAEAEPAFMRRPPQERKKLELKPRGSTTISEPEHHTATSKPSPFGAAKPIDNDAALKKYEERHQKLKEEAEKNKRASASAAAVSVSHAPSIVPPPTADSAQAAKKAQTPPAKKDVEAPHEPTSPPSVSAWAKPKEILRRGSDEKHDDSATDHQEKKSEEPHEQITSEENAAAESAAPATPKTLPTESSESDAQIVESVAIKLENATVSDDDSFEAGWSTVARPQKLVKRGGAPNGGHRGDKKKQHPSVQQ